MDFFDHPFFRNLMPIAFKNQLENIQFELDKICEDCHEDIEGVMEELDE